MKGLAPQTENLFHRIAALPCLQPFVLVGGTALAMQLGTRLSEDLDFMKWRVAKDEAMDVENEAADSHAHKRFSLQP